MHGVACKLESTPVFPNQRCERNHVINTISGVTQKISNILQNVAGIFAQQLVKQVMSIQKKTGKVLQFFSYNVS
jgi:hypothetical protein